MKHRPLAIAVAIATAALSLAACKSAASSTSASDAASPVATHSGASGLANAKALVAANSQEPTEIPIKTPLPRAPRKGIKVAFLSCQAAACSLLNPGFEAAAKALGWQPKVITYDSKQPGQALQQAIDAGYKYIATTSITLNTVTPQIRQAQAKGVAVFGAYTGDEPQGEKNGLYGVVQNFAASEKNGKLMAAWMIVNSNSNAHSVYVSLPMYPTLVAQGKASEAEFKADCPTCTQDTLGLSVDQLVSGKGPSTIVSYLQSHPDINYVYLSFQDLDTGIAAAIKSAGLANRVKIIGVEGQTAQLKAVINGTETAWSILPQPYVMWAVVDWMARLSVGVLDQAALDATSSGMQFMVDTPAAASAQLSSNGGEWPGPKNYEKQFKTLWQVG